MIKISMSFEVQCLIFLLLSLVLPRIPVVGKFFSVINTAVHEFGHAFMALLTQGSVEKIELFKDTSGVTTTKSTHTWKSILISLAGYPCATSVSWLLFRMIQLQAERGVIIGLSVLFFIMLMFWIRNGYGVLWVLLFCGFNILLLYKTNEQHIHYAALFYAFIMISTSIYDAVVLLVLSIRDSKKAGDATNLAKNTGIPALFWSVVMLAYTAWVVYKVVRLLFV